MHYESIGGNDYIYNEAMSDCSKALQLARSADVSRATNETRERLRELEQEIIVKISWLSEHPDVL
jgi:hypothetical protein